MKIQLSNIYIFTVKYNLLPLGSCWSTMFKTNLSKSGNRLFVPDLIPPDFSFAWFVTVK